MIPCSGAGSAGGQPLRGSPLIILSARKAHGAPQPQRPHCPRHTTPLLFGLGHDPACLSKIQPRIARKQLSLVTVA